MAEDTNPNPISLADAGPTTSADAMLNAMFEQQLEQMKQWKSQVATQMDVMRLEGLKLVERQKALALEKKALEEERANLGANRQRVDTVWAEVNEKSQRLEQRTAEVEEAQRRLAELQAQRTQADQELLTRQNELAGREAKFRVEDQSVREALRQLEVQRGEIAEAQDQLAGQRAQLDTQSRELAARALTLDQRGATLDNRERDLKADRRDLDQAQAELRNHQLLLTHREEAVAEKCRATEAELQSRVAALAANEQRLTDDCQSLLRQRQELQGRLQGVEREQAEQFESFAKQARSLAERRAEVDRGEAEMAQLLQSRIARAREIPQAELTKGREDEQRIARLESQLNHAIAAARTLQTREAQYQSELAAAQAQASQWKQELGTVSAERERAIQERTELSVQLAGQIQTAKEEAARLQGELDQARAQSKAGCQNLDPSHDANESLRADCAKHKAEALELQSAKDELLLELARHKEELPRQLAALREELAGQIAEREGEIARWKQQAEARAVGGVSQTPEDAPAEPENFRAELAQQREELRTRQERLVQVKRHLEKQEAVLAREHAHHKAFRTVAAVGIFVIMVVGSVFIGVYRFTQPVYRAEAVVQLAPPPELQGGDSQAWLKKQVLFLSSREITNAAWKVLRTPEHHYAMHDDCDGWVESLADHLNVSLNADGKSLAIGYTGPEAEGVSLVCNALASAYTTPSVREPSDETADFGQDAEIVAAAIPATHPIEDPRPMRVMTGVAAVLLGSLLLATMLRLFIARQLKEIDQMKHLDEVDSELLGTAARDPLTGVLNRAGFEQECRAALVRLQRDKRPAALVCLDVDQFKKINEIHGHVAGDEALRQIVAVVRDGTRATDLVGRLGDDEFAVLLPNCPRSKAEAIAERVRQNVADRKVETHGLSVSVGVRWSAGGAPATLEGLLMASDERMYAAKHEGGNRVCVQTD